MLQKLKILFLCTGNSCRSQMAEGWARHLCGDVIEPYSAGIAPHGLDRRAVRAMAEAGVDISGAHSKHLEEVDGIRFDCVVTVCDNAAEHCPVLPAARVLHLLHVGFADPPTLAAGAKTEDEALSHYRRVRDEIREFVEQLPSMLSQETDVRRSVMSRPSEAREAEKVRDTVRAGYADVARAGDQQSCCCSSKPCCGSVGSSADKFAETLGYNEAELAALPEGANMGLSCGNPTALAALRPGEVMVDLGSGGGFDCFLAGPRVGPTGRVIGVDMTPEMLAKARHNLESYRQSSGLENVEFRLGEIEHLPVADGSVDVVISNCVINLSPDKPQVWREIARILKPGGRVAVSDLALLRSLPDEVRNMVEALVGCVAGAVLVSETERFVREAGLVDIHLEQKPDYVASLADAKDPLYQKIAAALPPGAQPADFVTSLNVTARKPE